MATRGRMIPEMDNMSVEQLKAVKEQTDLEVNLLQDSLNNIRTATARLDIASNALRDLSLRPQGKKMLVPLTASLYVPGKLDDADNVLVDVGTGYFIEQTMLAGKDYCERKINWLKSNYDQLFEPWILLVRPPRFSYLPPFLSATPLALSSKHESGSSLLTLKREYARVLPNSF